MIASRTIESPVGPLLLQATERGVCTVHFAPGSKPRARAAVGGADGILDAAQRALEKYFAGDLSALEDVPVDASGTEFQRKVWRALRRIPPGKTRSYTEIARAIGNPKATRAVGMANRANPVAIIVPCHRVIGADGSLTGYAGRLDRKAWLLAHEGARARG